MGVFWFQRSTQDASSDITTMIAYERQSVRVSSPLGLAKLCQIHVLSSTACVEQENSPAAKNTQNDLTSKAEL